MINFIDTLISGRADKKLAYTDDVYDKELQKHQNQINKNLLKLIDDLNDIQDTLTSTDKNKALSANQGRLLKLLIDAKVIQVGGVAWDSEPVKDSNNAITSGAVYDAIEKITPIYVTQEDYDYLKENNMLEDRQYAIEEG